MENYYEIKRNLLKTINLCAPNGKVQRAFVDELHQWELAGESGKRVITEIVSLLYQGLAQDNWIGNKE